MKRPVFRLFKAMGKSLRLPIAFILLCTTLFFPQSVVSAQTPLPDLTITNITWSPATPKVGDAVTFSIVVKNIGNAPTPAGANMGCSFWEDGNSNGQWNYQTGMASIVPGQSVTITASQAWTATAGSHYISAVVDDQSNIVESNESNNSLATTLITALPDLTVTNITWSPATPKVGDLVTFSAVVKNIGNGPTPAGANLSCAFWEDGVPSGQWYLQTGAASIAPGQSVTLSAFQTWTATAGSHWVSAVVDDNGVIAESNESNNSLVATFTTGMPPLPPTNFTVSVAGSTYLYLSWQASSNAVYNVYRVVTAAHLIGYVPLAKNLLSPNFTVGGLIDGYTYTYVVSQTVNGIESVYSAQVSQVPGLVAVTPPPSGTMKWANDGPVTVYSDADPASGPEMGYHAKFVKLFTATSAVPGGTLYFDETCEVPADWGIVIYRPDGTVFSYSEQHNTPITHGVYTCPIGGLPPGYVVKLYFDAYADHSVAITNTFFEVWN